MFSLLVAALLLVSSTPPATQAPYPDIIYQHPDETTCVGREEVDENASWWFSQRFHYDRAADYYEKAARELTLCVAQHAKGARRVGAAHLLIFAGQYAYAAGDFSRACRLESEGKRDMLAAFRTTPLKKMDGDDRDRLPRDLELANESLAGRWGVFPGPNHTTIAHWHGDPPCPSR